MLIVAQSVLLLRSSDFDALGGLLESLLLVVHGSTEDAVEEAEQMNERKKRFSFCYHVQYVIVFSLLSCLVCYRIQPVIVFSLLSCSVCYRIQPVIMFSMLSYSACYPYLMSDVVRETLVKWVIYWPLNVTRRKESTGASRLFCENSAAMKLDRKRKKRQ